MGRFSLLRAWAHLFFVIGTLLINSSCRFNKNPASAQNDSDVRFISADDYGLNMKFEAALQTRADLALLFRVRTNTGMPLTKLRCDSFAVFEDAAPISQYESAFALKNKPEQFRMRTVLLLDLSGSVVKTSLDTLKMAAQSFVDTLLSDNFYSPPFNIDVSIFWFDGGAAINRLVDFQTDTAILKSAIRGLSRDSSNDPSTNLNGAVIDGINLIKSKVGKTGNLVSAGSLVIFTDGTDQAGRKTKEAALKEVQKAGDNINIYTLGLRGEKDKPSELDEPTLRQFGRDGFKFANNRKELIVLFKDFAKTIRDDVNSRYLLEYCSPRRKGPHKLQIKAFYANDKQQKLFGSFTVSYSADNFDGQCAFVVDSCSKYYRP